MSACWFDENNSGSADLYVANMWTAAGQQVVRHVKFPHKLNEAWVGHTKGNSFYRNQGNGKFKLESIGLEMGRWGWSADAADFDNDGRQELYLTCGMLTGPKQPDLMGFFWRQVVAKTPKTAVSSSPYENGWNAINQFIREGYSWNGNEPNVYYVKQGGSYRDSSSESGLNYASDSRAFRSPISMEMVASTSCKEPACSATTDRLPVTESWYRQALAADPQSPEANQGLGLTLAKFGRPAEAEPLLVAATKLRPAFPTAWNNLGVLHLQAGDTGKAIGALEGGIAASPEDELLYLNLGRAYLQIKRPDQARTVMQRLLKLQPNSQVAQQALKDLANVP